MHGYLASAPGQEPEVKLLDQHRLGVALSSKSDQDAATELHLLCLGFNDTYRKVWHR